MWRSNVNLRANPASNHAILVPEFGSHHVSGSTIASGDFTDAPPPRCNDRSSGMPHLHVVSQLLVRKSGTQHVGCGSTIAPPHGGGRSSGMLQLNKTQQQ
jgi:hypothetical protein